VKVKHSFLRWLIISAGVGLVAPTAWFMVQRLGGGQGQPDNQIAYPLERVIRVVWPSSFWLMATDGIEGTPLAYLFILIAVAANALLYAVLGSAAWSLKYLIVRAKS
jgi:hypothetical protein